MSLDRRDNPGEANPHRPNVPESVRNISSDLYYFLQEQASTLRQNHELSQAGDSTTPWEHMTYVDNDPRFSLGSVGRFVHPTYGLITARYVQFSDMDSTIFPGSPVGIDENIQEFQWLVTNKFGRSNPNLVQGVSAAYTIPKQGQYGWIIVNGVAVQTIGFGGDKPDQFTSLSWAATGVVGPVSDSIALGRLFGKDITQDGLAWILPGGSVYIDVLSLQEAKLNGISGDTSAVDERLFRLEQAFKGISYTVDVKLNESDIKLAQQNEMVNRTAEMISRRIAAIDVDGIKVDISDQVNLVANYANRARVDSENASAAALTSFTQLSASNIFSRTASIRADEAGYYADSATTSANAAETSRNAADTSAAASATSASNAAVSETNAGTSATSAQNSATSASTSAGTATTQAGIATTQAGNAATSAGNASTSASQASTSATNAAGSASTAASSAGTATSAATTATTQAGIATTQAGTATTQAGNAATSATNAGTYASNASTSAGQASTSATNAGTSATNAANSASAANTSSVNAASSATTATTQAGVATTQAGNAATSATAAAGSATTATNQATAASTSASNAATSATAAGTSASSANTSATNAATSATTATTQATNAANSATTASTQASNASTSASNASTSATAAGVSAGAASTSQTAAATSATSAGTAATTAQTATSRIQQLGFADGALYYLITPTPTVRETYVAVANEGTVLQTTSGTLYVQPLYSIAIESGRTYRAAIRFKNTVASVASMGFQVRNAAGTALGTIILGGANFASPTVFTTYSLDQTYAQIIAAYPTAATISAFMYANSTESDGAKTAQISWIRLDDVTDTLAAASSASAAATSASSAATQASNAGTSATAAQTSATNASTSAGNSSASATSASTSASTATTQATNAGTSATNAGTSATNAASSATTAATQASNSSVSAGNAATSATAASTSATSASNSATAASTSASIAASASSGSLNPNPNFSDWTGTLPSKWITFAGSVTKVTGLNGIGNGVEQSVAAGGVAGFQCDGFANNMKINNGTTVFIDWDVLLVSGTLQGGYIAVGIYDSSGTQLGGFTLYELSATLDVTGVAPGAGTTGRMYSYRKQFLVNNASAAYIGFYVETGNSSNGTTTAKTLRWYTARIRVVDALVEAAVATNSSAIVDLQGRVATADFDVTTVAGSATAALRLSSTSGGVTSSRVALEAEEIQLYNSVEGTRTLALKVVGGNTIVTGDLDAGKGVRVGTLRIPVALQSFQILCADGDTVSFGTDLGRIPKLLFDSTGAAPKAATETYDIKATSLTSSGFTMYAKIMTASSPSTATTAAGTDAGSGVTPRWQAQKPAAADSSTGYYTFSVTLNVVFSGFVSGEPNSATGYAAVDCYVRPSGGAWTSIGSLSQNFYASANGTLSKTLSGALYYANTIGIDASLTEFGVLASSGTITAFGGVTYPVQSTSGTSSATPSGQKIVVTVIPQNS